MKPTSSTTRTGTQPSAVAAATTAAATTMIAVWICVIFPSLVIFRATETSAFQMVNPPSQRIRTLIRPSSSSSSSPSVLYYNNDSIQDPHGLSRLIMPSINPTGRKLPPSSQAINMKQRLVDEITTFRRLIQTEQEQQRKQQEQVLDADLTKTKNGPRQGQQPQKVDYYSISEAVGNQAQQIIELCQNISEFNPTMEATRFLNDPDFGHAAPLNGAWKSLFTTASDADFSASKSRNNDSKASSSISSSIPTTMIVTSSLDQDNDDREETKILPPDQNLSAHSQRPNVQNIVDAEKGTITNVVDFFPSPSTSSTLSLLDKDDALAKTKLFELNQLNVVIKAKPLSPSRVGLDFKYAKLVITTQLRLLWLRNKFIKFSWPIFIPLPPTSIVRGIVYLNRLWKKATRRDDSDSNNNEKDNDLDTDNTVRQRLPPKPYFDLLYLDDDLRIHRTGEDNYFVQVKDTWTLTKPLLQQ